MTYVNHSNCVTCQIDLVHPQVADMKERLGELEQRGG